MVEQAAVNRWVVGSNPAEGANKWPVRLSVRTPGFQPVKTSSILVRATKSWVVNQSAATDLNTICDLICMSNLPIKVCSSFS